MSDERSSVAELSNLKELNDEVIFSENLRKLALLDEKSAEYIYTDTVKAQNFLSETLSILNSFDHPDFRLSYHLKMATLENLAYNYNLSEIHFRQALEILGERGNVNQLVDTYIDYAGTLINLEQQERAKFYLTQAAKYLKIYPDPKLKLRLICREGFYFLKITDYEKALKSFLDAEEEINVLPQKPEIKDYHFFTMVQSGLGSIYGILGEAKRSVNAYLKVVGLCEKMGMKYRMSWHYLNVGNGYMTLADIDNAAYYFKKAVKVIDDVNQQARALALANLGYCLLCKGQKKEAWELFKMAYPLFKDKREKNLANLEWWRGKILEEEKPKKALRHYFKALEFAKKGQDFRQAIGILNNISGLYAKELDYKNAYDYQVLYNQSVEKFMEYDRDNKIKELEVKYTAERKEKEAELLKLQVAGLQLKALRAQMNPHFVFNALNSVQNYITSNDTNQATKYLAQFAHLMRQSLEYSEKEVISLEKEIEFLRNYLDINMNLRFENKLKYEIIIDEEIEEDIYGVPTMIIQPYIENSIEHGIRSKESGLIKVWFKLYDDDTLLCVVEDDGIGREKARELQMKNPNLKHHKSLGTKITQDRLDILHKDKEYDHKPVLIEDLVNELNGEALGTRVKILIPIVDIQ